MECRCGRARGVAELIQMSPSLTKSLFTAGLQCHKLLWWKVHEADAVELQPDIVLQDRFDQGAQVGALARELFSGGTLIDHFDTRELRIARTRSAIEARVPIYEGTFEADGVQIKADILLPDGDNGWRLIEVKSSSSQKDEHIPDAAVQAWVIGKTGIQITRVEIMHLNKEFRHPDNGALLDSTDVTGPVFGFIPEVPYHVERQLKILESAVPELEIGIHCDEPRECPFQKRCWPQRRDHISKLHSVGPKRAASHMKDGVHWISDYRPKPTAKPSNQAMTIQRQIRAMKEDRAIVEPTLGKALEAFSGRLGFLDFETIARAVPVWPGMAPWEQAAAQFSYHEAQPDGTYSHAEFLAEGPGDARPLLAKAMVEATAHADRVVMYTSFEKTRIRGLQECVPELRAELETLEHKLIDLHPIVRDHVYHPAFEGSFSLKYVLPALVPELTYNDLVIVNGLVASVEIARLLFVSGRIPEGDRRRVRQDLLDYCKRDTFATVRIVERLRELSVEA
jgi:predicted RecB family nuclease